MFRNKNVPGVATIHHALCNVDPSAGDICLFVQISDLVNRPAMNSHADVKLGMIFQFLADFECAQNWCFGTVAKNERAAVAGR